MRTFRLRWYSEEPPPGIGDYIVPSGPRCRAAYLVLGAVDRGKRGGLGEEVYRLFVLSIERCPRAEALAGRYCEVLWDRPAKRRARRLAEYAAVIAFAIFTASAHAGDWEIVLPGGETMCATGRDTCEELRAAIKRGTAYPGAPAPGSTTICRPHPGCFTRREGCIPGYQGPRPEGYCR